MDTEDAILEAEKYAKLTFGDRNAPTSIAYSLLAIAKELQFMNRFNIELQGYLNGFDYSKHDIPRPPDDDDPADPNYKSPFLGDSELSKDVPF